MEGLAQQGRILLILFQLEGMFRHSAYQRIAQVSLVAGMHLTTVFSRRAILLAGPRCPGTSTSRILPIQSTSRQIRVLLGI